MRHSPQYDIPPDETSVGREAIAERISRLRPTTKALYERLRSSLTEKQIERLRAGRRCLVVVQAPDDGWESTVKHAFRAAVQEAAQDHDRRVAVQAWEASAPARHSTSIEDVLALLLSADVALMVTGEDATARSSVTTIADLVVHVPSFDPHFLLTLVAEKLGGKPEKWPDDWDATKLTPTRVDLALARAADPEEALAWLRIPSTLR